MLWQGGHSHNNNPINLCTWEVFPSSRLFYIVFLVSVFSLCLSSTPLTRCLPVPSLFLGFLLYCWVEMHVTSLSPLTHCRIICVDSRYLKIDADCSFLMQDCERLMCFHYQIICGNGYCPLKTEPNDVIDKQSFLKLLTTNYQNENFMYLSNYEEK